MAKIQIEEQLLKDAASELERRAKLITELQTRLDGLDAILREHEGPTLKSALAAALSNPRGSGLTSSITIGHSDEPNSLGGGDLSAAVPNLFGGTK